MDHSLSHNTPPITDEEDEWDTDGFVIPSLGIEGPDNVKPDASAVEPSKHPSPKAKKEENIYLGPHGAPPSQSKQQELNYSGRKQRFKQKLKEADRRIGGNKLENSREIVGDGNWEGKSQYGKGFSQGYLHCHESQFEKSSQ